MILLGLRLENDLKMEFEDNFENELVFVDNVINFMEAIKSKKFDAILIDEKNSKEDALINLITKILEIQKRVVIIILGETSNLGVIAGSIKAGAYDYILKPEKKEEIVKIVEKSVKDNKILGEKVDKSIGMGDKLIGRSKAMVNLYKVIGKVASSSVPVLVSGERGTGKTSVAKAIHQFSFVNKKPLISVNCNSYRSTLLERKLFGYEKGSFEGAVYSQYGELEKAEGGILHLANIESLSLEMQSNILFLLEENKFFRLGAGEPINAFVRIIASTSANLEELISKGLFIDELYRKLKVLEIDIPTLRERKEDIPFIVDHYIAECNKEMNKNIKGITKVTLKKLMRYDWPGNVNELKNAIKYAVAMARGGSILLEDLPPNVMGEKLLSLTEEARNISLETLVKNELGQLRLDNKNSDYYYEVISRVEKELIKQVLEITNGKKIETAELLGITRNTLRTKMNNYDLE
ncbi:sigma-54 dependent transcriptional regulator [Fusobacterium massiliense]|uniref:sigma-54-dependent transcriptional regulator n=1 Tax=Fusobacterium massiliense TaxID=1852365 RepID=UPI0028E7EB55|nr:sigma-54 dependent transcriptional regulator [Fusobacterium massiliense]